MKSDPRQSDIVGLVWFTGAPRAHRLSPGDIIRIDRRLCRVIRVNDCAAVVLMNLKGAVDPVHDTALTTCAPSVLT